MSTDLHKDELIARYLLGDLTEEQQIEIEDRAFLDQDYRQNITAVENDLIDEYVRRELPETQRRQFEHLFLTSADRRRRIDFARALSTVVNEAEVTEKESQPAFVISRAGWRESLSAFLQGLTPAARFSMAIASLLLVAFAAWLVTQSVRQRSQLARLESDQQSRQNKQQDLERQIDAERKRNEQLVAQLEQEKQQRQQSDELINQIQREAEDSTQQPSRNTILSLALLPGISRTGSGRPKLLLLESARLVQLQIGIEPEEQYTRFRVELGTGDGRTVWTRDNLSARTTRSGKTIGLTLPAKVLSAGRYELALKGVTDKGTAEDVGYYYFEVLKK